MMNKQIVFLCLLIFISCKVTFITGYDHLIDEGATKLKADFNLHYIKLNRTLHDKDPHNQDYKNFENYYDQMEVDMILLKDRALYLPKKASIVKMQVLTLDTLLMKFKELHQQGLRDQVEEPRFYETYRSNINSGINAIVKLQQELNAGKTK